MDKITIYFLRHGDVDNPRRILYGRLPRFSLADIGLKKIENLSEYFLDQGIKQIYTSPLLRARQTAMILGRKLKVVPQVSSLLNEVKVIFEGVTLKNYQKNIQPRLYNQEFIDQGQESIANIASRMIKFIKIIFKKYPNKKIIAVSHGDPIMILKAVSSGKQFTWDYKYKNYLKCAEFVILKYSQDRFNWENSR